MEFVDDDDRRRCRRAAAAAVRTDEGELRTERKGSAERLPQHDPLDSSKAQLVDTGRPRSPRRCATPRNAVAATAVKAKPAEVKQCKGKQLNRHLSSEQTTTGGPTANEESDSTTSGLDDLNSTYVEEMRQHSPIQSHSELLRGEEQPLARYSWLGGFDTDSDASMQTS